MNFYTNKEIQKIIFNAYQNPKYKKENINVTNKTITEHSKICVDDLQINFSWNNAKLINVEYKAIGCAVFLASCDLMCELIMNKHIDEIKEISNLYFDLINNKNISDNFDKLDKLLVFKNVGTHLNRIECASIIYRALKREINE